MIYTRHYFAFTAILFIFSINATAQTHVRGYVSGTWTPAGSPYIADSTIVIHQDSLLVIQPGVDVRFPGYRDSLKVEGELRAWGTENDSITFFGRDWNGIRFYPTAAQNTRMEYCNIASGHRVFRSDSVSITFQRCIIGSIDNLPMYINYSPLITLRNSRIISYLALQYSTCIVENNLLEGHLSIEGSSVSVRNNVFYDGCYITGSGIFENNTMINQSLHIYYNVRVLNNYIVGHVFLTSCADTVANNEIYGRIQIGGGCPYVRNNLVINEGRCIDGGPVELVNNTLICFNDRGAGEVISFGWREGGNIRNNILLGSGNDCVGIRYHSPTTGRIISYNTYWNIGTLYHNCSPTAGDTLADPRLVDVEEGDYTLRPDSPCIDSADPYDPNDPDGTRRDRGYAFFDNRIDHPPVIFSPTSAIAQRGFEFSYTARAVDDRGTLTLSFLDLPSWLTVNQREFVYDSLTVCGEVTAGTSDFSFTVIAEDGSAQTDTERVEVETTEYTVLTGNISGFLPVRRSPYLMVDSLFVPAGSSLVIEPGCVLKAKYHEMLVHRASLNVYGQLTAVGTEEDSIYFISERTPGQSWDWHGIIISGRHPDISTISHCQFEAFDNGIYLKNDSATIINQNSFSYGSIGIHSKSSDSILVCQNLMHDMREHYVSISARGSSVTIANNQLEVSRNFVGGISTDSSYIYIHHNIVSNIYINNNSDADVLQNVILNSPGWSTLVSNGSYARIINNTIINGREGIWLDYFSIVVKNNIICNCREKGIYSYEGRAIDTLMNNDVWCPSGVNYYNIPNPQLGVPAMVNINGDSCDIYGNISMYPLFIGGASFSYHLLPNSPCIDAGDPNSHLDPDSTIADIGAYFFDQRNLSPLMVTIQPHNPPIRIPSGGGYFDYTVTIQNTSTAPVDFQAKTEVVLPDGRIYGPLLSRGHLTISAGGVLTRQINQYVPDYAPVGEYIYTAAARVVLDSTLAADCFPFTKLSGEEAPAHNWGWTVSGWERDEEAVKNLEPEFRIYPINPNPFNSTTVIEFDLPRSEKVSLIIYNTLGEEVDELWEGKLPSGQHRFIWRPEELSSGVYFIFLRAGSYERTKKCIYLR